MWQHEVELESQNFTQNDKWDLASLKSTTCLATVQDEEFDQSNFEQFITLHQYPWCCRVWTFYPGRTAENFQFGGNCSPPTCCPASVSLVGWSNYQQQPRHNGRWSRLRGRTGRGLGGHMWLLGSKRSLAHHLTQNCTHRDKIHINTTALRDKTRHDFVLRRDAAQMTDSYYCMKMKSRTRSVCLHKQILKAESVNLAYELVNSKTWTLIMNQSLPGWHTDTDKGRLKHQD